MASMYTAIPSHVGASWEVGTIGLIVAVVVVAFFLNSLRGKLKSEIVREDIVCLGY
jgi:hypothetical protein